MICLFGEYRLNPSPVLLSTPKPVGIVLNYWPRHKTTGPGIHWLLVKWPTPHWLFVFFFGKYTRGELLEAPPKPLEQIFRLSTFDPAKAEILQYIRKNVVISYMYSLKVCL